jgi:AcrR family transcriptional regulator
VTPGVQAFPDERSTARESPESDPRRLIAEAAARVISRGGLEDATLRRIAAEIGSTTGLISHYFPTKAELLTYVLDYAISQLDHLGSLDGWSTFEDFMDDVSGVKASKDGLRRRAIFARVWIAYQGASIADERVAAEYVRWDERWRRKIIDVTRVKLGPSPSEATVEIIADALNALCDGLTLRATFDPERYTPERLRQIMASCSESLATTMAL